jgi:threonine dehydratase
MCEIHHTLAKLWYSHPPQWLMITFAAIQSASERIAPHVLSTPCVKSKTLSHITGAQVFLKFENLQFTSSFKERGACNKLSQLPPDTKGVVAMSAGNHAQGVAHHAQRLGLRAVIVMPQFTPGVKIDNTRRLGAEVILHGDTLDEARGHALEIAKEQSLTLVHPYDDEQIVAGQGTVALEMLRDVPDLDTLIVAIGGGGLMGGMALAAKTLRPQIELIGVQTERFPSMYNVIKGMELPQGLSTIAEGIAVPTPGVIARELIAQHVKDIVLVDESEIEQAIVMLLEIEKTLVEGAGAAGLAALIKHKERFVGKKLGLVLCGGNLDPLLLASIIERGMVKSGRLARIRVGARDVPGSLAKITAAIAQAGANVNEVQHQRAFTLQAAQNVDIELVIQARGHEHVAQVIEALVAQGMKAAVC